MPDDLKNWISEILTLADLGQSSGTELVRHFLVKSNRILKHNFTNLQLIDTEILPVNFINS